MSGNSITLSTRDDHCANDGAMLGYTDPCGEPLGDSDTPDVRFSVTCPCALKPHPPWSTERRLLGRFNHLRRPGTAAIVPVIHLC